MKPKLRLLAAVWLAWLTTLGADAATYIVTNAPGWNLIANQQNNAVSNRAVNLFPGATVNSRVMKYNLATKSFQTTEILTVGASWVPGTNVFNPGEGLYFSNASAVNYIWTNTGNAFTPVLPLSIGTNVVLVARQTNALGSVTNILGFPPVNGTVVYRFNPGAGRDPNIFAPPHYTVYVFKAGAWGGTEQRSVSDSRWRVRVDYHQRYRAGHRQRSGQRGGVPQQYGELQRDRVRRDAVHVPVVFRSESHQWRDESHPRRRQRHEREPR